MFSANYMRNELWFIWTYFCNVTFLLLVVILVYSFLDSVPDVASENEASDDTSYTTEEVYSEFMARGDTQSELISLAGASSFIVETSSDSSSSSADRDIVLVADNPDDPDFVYETYDDTEPQETSYETEIQSADVSTSLDIIETDFKKPPDIDETFEISDSTKKSKEKDDNDGGGAPNNYIEEATGQDDKTGFTRDSGVASKSELQGKKDVSKKSMALTFDFNTDNDDELPSLPDNTKFNEETTEKTKNSKNLNNTSSESEETDEMVKSFKAAIRRFNSNLDKVRVAYETTTTTTTATTATTEHKFDDQSKSSVCATEPSKDDDSTDEITKDRVESTSQCNGSGNVATLLSYSGERSTEVEENVEHIEKVEATTEQVHTSTDDIEQEAKGKHFNLRNATEDHMGVEENSPEATNEEEGRNNEVGQMVHQDVSNQSSEVISGRRPNDTKISDKIVSCPPLTEEAARKVLSSWNFINGQLSEEESPGGYLSDQHSGENVLITSDLGAVAPDLGEDIIQNTRQGVSIDTGIDERADHTEKPAHAAEQTEVREVYNEEDGKVSEELDVTGVTEQSQNNVSAGEEAETNVSEEQAEEDDLVVLKQEPVRAIDLLIQSSLPVNIALQ